MAVSGTCMRVRGEGPLPFLPPHPLVVLPHVSAGWRQETGKEREEGRGALLVRFCGQLALCSRYSQGLQWTPSGTFVGH